MSKETIESMWGPLRPKGKRAAQKAESASTPRPARAHAGSAKKNGNGHGHPDAIADRETMMRNAVGGAVPVTEWDRLSAPSRAEVESLVEVLKAVKQGDFSVRFDYEKRGVLTRVGEILTRLI